MTALVILDCDGVLIDSELLGRFGRRLDLEQPLLAHPLEYSQPSARATSNVEGTMLPL